MMLETILGECFTLIHTMQTRCLRMSMLVQSPERQPPAKQQVNLLISLNKLSN